jgi:hypothetical protein
MTDRRSVVLALNIFNGIIEGYKARGMFGHMEPALLGTGKHAHLIFYLISGKGLKIELVQSKILFQKCSTISAIEDFCFCSHEHSLLNIGCSVYRYFLIVKLDLQLPV